MLTIPTDSHKQILPLHTHSTNNAYTLHQQALSILTTPTANSLTPLLHAHCANNAYTHCTSSSQNSLDIARFQQLQHRKLYRHW